MNERNKKSSENGMFVGLIFAFVLCIAYLPYLTIKTNQSFNNGVAQAQASARSLAGPDVIVAFDAISQSIIASNCVKNTRSSHQSQSPSFGNLLASKENFAKNKAKGSEIWIQCFNNQVAMLTISTDSEQLEGLRALSARLAN